MLTPDATQPHPVLKARLQQRDDVATSFLYDECRLAARAAAHAFSLGRSDERDLHHDGFVLAMRRIDTFQEHRALRPWVRALTYNLARDLLRARRRAEAALALPAEGPHIVDGPLTDLLLRERASLVEAAATRLKAPERSLLVMRTQSSEPYHVLAVRLGISVGTAKVRVHRALRRLRRAVLDKDRD